jgi:DNA-binding transcriptional ArsR family regulator
MPSATAEAQVFKTLSEPVRVRIVHALTPT